MLMLTAHLTGGVHAIIEDVTTVSKKRCVFCQASGYGVKFTQEHVLPEWLRTSALIEFGEGEEVARLNGRRVGKPRRAKPFNRRPHIVCQQCNNGWMKELEDRARPILLPLLDGFKITLPLANQRVVAAWAAKTCFALMYSDRYSPHYVPGAHYQFMAERKGAEPPSEVGVLLAYDDSSTEGDEIIIADGAGRRAYLWAFAPREVTVLPPGTDVEYPVYVLTLRIHRLVCVVVGSATLPLSYGPIPYIGEPEYLRRVWPLNEVPVLWPPRLVSEGGGFNALSGRPARWED
jgi:hypothetical protein